MSWFCLSKLVSTSRNFGKSLRKEKLNFQVLVRFRPIRELLDEDHDHIAYKYTRSTPQTLYRNQAFFELVLHIAHNHKIGA